MNFYLIILLIPIIILSLLAIQLSLSSQISNALVLMWGLSFVFQFLESSLKCWFLKGRKLIIIGLFVLEIFIISVVGGGMFVFLKYPAAYVFGVQILPLVLCVCCMLSGIGVASCKEDRIESYYGGKIVYGFRLCFFVSLIMYCVMGCTFGFYLSFGIPFCIYCLCDCFDMFTYQRNSKEKMRVCLYSLLGMILLTLVALFVFLTFSHGIVFLKSRFYDENEYEIVGHRGTRGATPDFPPENSMAAFREAIEVGANGVEFDIQFTKDKRIVIIHDETVDRTTNGTGKVAEMTWDELKTLKLKTQNEKYENETIPLYEDLLYLFATHPKAQNMTIATEVKSPHNYRGYEKHIYDMVVKYNMTERNIFVSFDAVALCVLKGINPLVKTVRNYGFTIQSILPVVPYSSELVGMDALRMFKNPWNIMKARSENRSFFMWFGLGESEPWFVKYFAFLGVDYLVVDNVREIVNHR